jgi:hypothetical protein
MKLLGVGTVFFLPSLSTVPKTHPPNKEIYMDKNLLSFDNRSYTQDGHGGKAEEHRKEMEEIARRV